MSDIDHRVAFRRSAVLAIVLVELACAPAGGGGGGSGGGGGAGQVDAAARDALRDLLASRDVLAMETGPSPLCDRYQTDSGAVPTYAVIQQIFDDNCTSCHTGDAPLDLSAGNSFANIVGHLAPAVESCGGILVAPGDPDGSYLYQKLTNDYPCIGSRMPRGDIQAYPLPACVTDLVRAWILAGALGPAGAVDGGGGGGDGGDGPATPGD